MHANYMQTIEAYEKDILLQQEFLKNNKKPRPISSNSQKNIIFTGSGDSLAAAKLAEAFSDFRVKALDPLDLLKNKSIATTKTVYFVSISGNTISNIKVARTAKKSIAITSRPKSRLAKACNHSIILQSPNSDVFTAGSISFLESALTCITLVSPILIPKIDMFKKAVTATKNFKTSKRIFVLGNMHTYPVAMYCAAKFYELLGYYAHYERLEQFSHMELFSAKKGDTVVIFEEKIHMRKSKPVIFIGCFMWMLIGIYESGHGGGHAHDFIKELKSKWEAMRNLRKKLSEDPELREEIMG